jgi:hypothetical protein
MGIIGRVFNSPESRLQVVHCCHAAAAAPLDLIARTSMWRHGWCLLHMLHWLYFAHVTDVQALDLQLHGALRSVFKLPVRMRENTCGAVSGDGAQREHVPQSGFAVGIW